MLARPVDLLQFLSGRARRPLRGSRSRSTKKFWTFRSFLSDEKKLSIAALSQTLPERLM
jgi:hypothetical protein